MSDIETETKYKPFSNKRFLAFSLTSMILTMMWAVRGWVQFYAKKALNLQY